MKCPFCKEDHDEHVHCLVPENVRIRARIAELEAEVAILKDVRATEQYLASLPVGDKELDFAKRTATEAALRYVQKRWPHFYLNEPDIQGCLKALLGEDA